MMELTTNRLTLRLQDPGEILDWITGLEPEVKAEISAEWMERLNQAEGPDPWSCLFDIVENESGESVGTCGFKGPPVAGVVEIAYSIVLTRRGEGLATEATEELIRFAETQEMIHCVHAHTKQQNGASERVLEKLGFEYCGPWDDPDDGEVRRWKKICQRD